MPVEIEVPSTLYLRLTEEQRQMLAVLLYRQDKDIPDGSQLLRVLLFDALEQRAKRYGYQPRQDLPEIVPVKPKRGRRPTKPGADEAAAGGET